MEKKTIIWTDSFESFAGETSFSIEQKGQQRYLVIRQRKAEIEGDPESRFIIIKPDELDGFIKLLYNSIKKDVEIAAQKSNQSSEYLKKMKEKYGQNSHERWSKEEEDLVSSLYKKGVPINKISKQVQRSDGGVIARLKKLGFNLSDKELK